MLKKIYALMLALLLCCGGALAQELTMDEAVDQAFRRAKTVGGALVVAMGDEIVYERYYGVQQKTTGVPVSADTYFRCASVTKLVTGIGLLQLMDQGVLAPDTDISEYLGYTVYNPRYPDSPVTLRQLMSHTSSINAGGGYANDLEGYVWKLLSLERSRTANYYKQKPGSKYVYSNFGAGLMGSLIELVTGQNINVSVTNGLFDPLGIDAAYNVNLLNVPEKIVNLYNDKGELETSRETYLSREWDPNVDPEYHFKDTAGRLWMRGEDLCRLGILLCQGGTLDGVTILEPKTVAAMMESQLGKPGITCDSKYGLCIYRKSELLKERIVYGHQGMSEGVVAALFFEPESQLVFSVITNGCNDVMVNYMANINRKLFLKTWEIFGDPDVK